MQDPSIIHIDNLERYMLSSGMRSRTTDALTGKEVWIPARPLGYPSLKDRLRATWLVFTGKADALLWRGQ